MTGGDEEGQCGEVGAGAEKPDGRDAHACYWLLPSTLAATKLKTAQ